MGKAQSGNALKILAVDDQEEGLFALCSVLELEGYTVLKASDGAEAWRAIQEDAPDLVLLDVNMPEMDGLEVTKRAKSDALLRYIPIVLLTANDSLDDLQRGFDHGADDYIRKPFKREELIARVAAALRTRRLYQELRQVSDERQALQDEVVGRFRFSDIIGHSSSMQEIYSLIEKVKDAQVPVLITGESGTGKELVAKAIHYNSPRANKAFIVQNCSAFNENLLESELFGHVRGAFTGAVRDKPGLFEAADKGTFFLDELGEMSPALQVKLLRVLQDGTFTPVGATSMKKVDVRIVAATHRNLMDMVAKGSFREDLYYRLNVVNLRLPPLRERQADIPLLAEHFLQLKSRKHGRNQKKLTSDALARLSTHTWPGNIRELENEIERLVIMSGTDSEIPASLVSPQIGGRTGGSTVITSHDSQSGFSLKDEVARVERQLIEAALKRTSGNKSEAARDLGISRSNLIAKAKEYGLESEAEK